MEFEEENFISRQRELCQKYGVVPLVSKHNQLVVVSDGVFEGASVEGVRYPSPKHMSGWWLATGKYTGDPDTLRTEHVFHLFEKRPDLVKFLALPYGFRFRTNGAEEVWFDEGITRETAD